MSQVYQLSCICRPEAHISKCSLANILGWSDMFTSQLWRLSWSQVCLYTDRYGLPLPAED